MNAVFRRELSAYYHSMTAWVFGAFLLLFAGIYTMVYGLKNGYAFFEYVLDSMSFIFLIAIPILTMRVVAEERRLRTDQLLYSLPLRMSQVVLGKYFAMLVVIAIPIAVMGLYPLILSLYGTITFATAYGVLFGFFLLGAALAAIGMFISSMTENQAVAAGVCFAVMLVLFFMSSLADYVDTGASSSFFAFAVLILLLGGLVRLLTKNTPAALLTALVGECALGLFYWLNSAAFEGLFAKVMDVLSVFERFYTFINGVFDLTAVLYFLTVIGVSLFFTVQSMEKRRWN